MARHYPYSVPDELAQQLQREADRLEEGLTSSSDGISYLDPQVPLDPAGSDPETMREAVFAMSPRELRRFMRQGRRRRR
jgi:hypothetical protein